MQYPSVVKNFKVYNAVNAQFIGLADITNPKIMFEKDSLKGAGLAGSMNLPVSGNLQPMTMDLTWHTPTIESFKLFNGASAKIRCLASIQMYDTASGQFVEQRLEEDATVLCDEFDLGKFDNSTKAANVLRFSVIYLALWFNNVKYWELDPFSNVVIVNSVDLNATTRINIGG
jgi:P2 family phage contractile tail tube protein